MFFILVKLEWNLNYRDTFSENTLLSNFIKIRPVEAELWHADMTKHFRQFCKRAENKKKKTFGTLYLCGPVRDSTASKPDRTA